jgi:hypothetical protein
MRRTYVSMTWTPGVDVADARLLLRTVEDIYELLRGHFGTPGQFDPLPGVRVFGAWSIQSMPTGSAYSDINWYVDRSLDDEQETILASRYIDTVSLEPWQSSHPHYDLALTDLPVCDDVSGEGRRELALGLHHRGIVSLVSTRLFDSIKNVALRHMAMQHTFVNYLGLMFGIPAHGRAEHVEYHDDDPYCTNVCAMRYTDSPKTALAFAQEQVAQGVLLCSECQRDLVARVTGVYYGLN